MAAARTWSQAALRGELVEDLRDLNTELRGALRGAVDVIGFYLAIRQRERDALVALSRVAEELVDFDTRCEAGDVEGAVEQLRAFLRRVRA